MKHQDLPAIGAPLNGGFYTGIINVNGTHFAVLTAPKATGEVVKALLPEDKLVATSTFDSDTACETGAKSFNAS